MFPAPSKKCAAALMGNTMSTLVSWKTCLRDPHQSRNRAPDSLAVCHYQHILPRMPVCNCIKGSCVSCVSLLSALWIDRRSV